MTDRVELADQRLNRLPLVVTEVVDHAKQHFLPLVKQRKNCMFHHIVRHNRSGNLVCILYSVSETVCTLKPTLVVLRYPFTKSCIRLRALVVDERTHRCVLQLDVPFAERTLDGLPFFDGRSRVDHIRDVAPFLTIVLLHLFCHDLLLMNMLLETQQDLARVNGLDQVIGYLLAYCLFHDVLLFGFGDHHYRHFGAQSFDLLQGLQTGHSGHVLI